jgi:hypothetical protein
MSYQTGDTDAQHPAIRRVFGELWNRSKCLRGEGLFVLLADELRRVLLIVLFERLNQVFLSKFSRRILEKTFVPIIVLNSNVETDMDFSKSTSWSCRWSSYGNREVAMLGFSDLLHVRVCEVVSQFGARRHLFVGLINHCVNSLGSPTLSNRLSRPDPAALTSLCFVRTAMNSSI